MNQDFGLSLTPPTARRLIRIQQACNAILPESLLDIALRERIDEDAFDQFVCPYDENKREITQFLLDCGLRGVIQQIYHPEFDDMATFNVIRLLKPKFVTIYTDQADRWKSIAKAHFMDSVTKATSNVTSEDIDERRSGVFIVDGPPTQTSVISAMSRIRNYASEFPRTIIFDRCANWSFLTPWTVWAQCLWPTMPTPLYPRIVKNVAEAYNKPLHMFAPLYNTCLFPELMNPTILEHLTDKYLHSRLRTYRFDL